MTAFQSAYINAAPQFKEDGAIAALPRHPIRFADLPTRAPTVVTLTPDKTGLTALASELELPELRKFRFEAAIAPDGDRAWRLNGRLGATAVQTCVATLGPVTTRIDEDVLRRYSPDAPEPEGDEVEMPEDTDTEPLVEAIDLYDVALEALAIALPAFPRVPEAADVVLAVTEPGKTPMTDEAARPFAGLAGLRDRLDGSDDDTAD